MSHLFESGFLSLLAYVLFIFVFSLFAISVFNAKVEKLEKDYSPKHKNYSIVLIIKNKFKKIIKKES